MPTPARNQPCPPSGPDDGLGDPAVKRAEPAFVMAGMIARGELLRMRDAHHQPRRDHHRDEEGKQHRHRGIGRNRRHIGAHQAGDEHHRQKRGDHRQGRDDGRIADLGHRMDRRLDRTPLVAHAPVAVDILDHDDRIVDQNADREDEREQADPIDRVAHQIRGEEREQNRGRNHDQGNARLLPADRKADQHDDRKRRKAEMEQQFVRLVVRGLAVVPRDRDIRDPPAAAGLEEASPARRHGPPRRRRLPRSAWRWRWRRPARRTISRPPSRAKRRTRS